MEFPIELSFESAEYALEEEKDGVRRLRACAHRLAVELRTCARRGRVTGARADRGCPGFGHAVANSIAAENEPARQVKHQNLTEYKCEVAVISTYPSFTCAAAPAWSGRICFNPDPGTSSDLHLDQTPGPTPGRIFGFDLGTVLNFDLVPALHSMFI
ncbi:hypothetical protein EVAR_62481_1 [Eumeta japonica]|uniref:Uncharacterized protein n=1 Tax=Eumeta variegata TaxID=151549 RepID=A0A4C1ZLM5_EUMVA|nr:hypothetical protein EVAR_62481_1 [Eumeta japonica]